MSAQSLAKISLVQDDSSAEPGADPQIGVTVDQKPNAQVPTDAAFRDETGQGVSLGQLFGKRPMILTLVYYVWFLIMQ